MLVPFSTGVVVEKGGGGGGDGGGDCTRNGRPPCSSLRGVCRAAVITALVVLDGRSLRRSSFRNGRCRRRAHVRGGVLVRADDVVHQDQPERGHKESEASGPDGQRPAPPRPDRATPRATVPTDHIDDDTEALVSRFAGERP